MARQSPPPVLDEEADLESTCAILNITPDDLIAELQRREAAKVAKMRREMILAQRGGGQRRILRDEGDGGGYVEFMVHPVSYHYWGRRLGYECWDDRQFIREYLRDNPAARIRQVGSAISVHRGARRTRVAVQPSAPRALPKGTILDAYGRAAA